MAERRQVLLEYPAVEHQRGSLLGLVVGTRAAVAESAVVDIAELADRTPAGQVERAVRNSAEPAAPAEGPPGTQDSSSLVEQLDTQGWVEPAALGAAEREPVEPGAADTAFPDS